jgi:hypothetical protein
MEFLLGKMFRSVWVSVAALVVVVLSLVLPPGGPPFPLCQFKVVTGLPCFGCGLTRSFIGVAHFNLVRAVTFHPASLYLFPFVVVLGALLFVPRHWRETLGRWSESHPRLVNYSAAIGIGLFFLYGTVRLLYCYLLQRTHQPLPW